MKIISLITFLGLTLLSLTIITPVLAEVGTGQIDVTLTQPPGYGIPGFGSSGEGLVSTIVKNVIFLFFAVGGLGTIIYFIWGAVDWILSGGDKEKVSNARKKMTHAIIGLTLLALSFVIIRVIGQIVGFNPLGDLQLRNLGDQIQFVPNR